MMELNRQYFFKSITNYADIVHKFSTFWLLCLWSSAHLVNWEIRHNEFQGSNDLTDQNPEN